MLNRNCKTSFAKPEFLKKAQRENPRLYDIGCYIDNLSLMLAHESDEVIRLEKESRSKLSDLIRPFDYEKLNNLYDLFVPQREKFSKQRYFSERSKMSHTPVNNENSKETFNKQTTLLEKRMDESIPYDQKCKSSKEFFKIKRSVGTIFEGVERCKETIAKRTDFGHIDPFIQNTIKANFCPEIRRISADLEKFHLYLKEEMVADQRYFHSLEHEKYYYVDHMNIILGVYTELDEVTNLQCDYLEMLEKSECHEIELSKSEMMSKSFEALQKHAINLEIDLQQCQEKIKNDKSFKENQSKEFRKECEQYFEIQDLKAQLQDKGIAISELKKLIEKLKGKYVDTNFEKSSVIRQPDAFKSQRPSILGKPTIFLDSLKRNDFSKSKPVTKNNVSNDFSKPITAQILPPNKKSILKNTNVLPPGIPHLKGNQMEDRVMLNNSQGNKQEVEDHRRNVKFSKNKTSVTACNDSLNAKTLNVNFVCATCGKCVLNEKHDMCVLKSRNSVNSRTKIPMVTYLVEIILFIINSGCSKHMTGNLKLLINFVEKFLGTMKFGNDKIAPILGYRDLVQGEITIKRVYYVEGLNQNLFSVGQFCDADLEVAFRKLTCYIHDLKGNDLLTGSRGTDLYSITLQDTTSPNPNFLMAKPTSSQACKNRNTLLETSNKVLVEKLKSELEDFRNKNKSLTEANDKLSKENDLLFADFKKSKAELKRHDSIAYASEMELECAKVKELKNKLSAHQDTISILNQQKDAQIKLYKSREDKEIEKVIDLENKVKVLDNIVYKTGQTVQMMNMLNNKSRTSFVKPEYLKKAKQANPRLYDIGCYNDNLALMLSAESDEVIRLEKESRSKLKRSRVSHITVQKEKKSFNKQLTFLEKRLDKSIPLASRFSTPPLACEFFNPGATEKTSINCGVDIVIYPCENDLNCFSFSIQLIVILKTIVDEFMIRGGVNVSLDYGFPLNETDTQEKDKNKAKNDKTEHGMEKIKKKTKSFEAKSQKSKLEVNHGKVKVKPDKAKAKMPRKRK
nr:integrase, catalytic region, zinc finger, CCHC-type, peptidase aspartic, catalytic [Tanacetum cinerariifolium]